MDLEEILNLDISELKKEYQNKIESKPQTPDLNHRFSFGIMPKTVKTETLDFLDKAYHRTGKYPPIKNIDDYILSLGFRKGVPSSREDWVAFLSDADFEEILINRGLPTYDSIPNKIDLNFSLAVTLICDISDKRSLAAKLKDAGLTTRQWEGFLKRKSHYDYFNSRLTKVWDEEVEQKAKLGIIRSVEAGDLTAIKYFHEYTDRYRPQDQQLINLQLIITGLLEILAKHLTKEVLITVAMELEQTGLLSTNKFPAALPVGD